MRQTQQGKQNHKTHKNTQKNTITR